MHKPNPKYGWRGQETAALPNKSVVRWTGEEPKVTIRLRSVVSRNIGYIAKSFKPDPSRVPDAHFHFDLT